jgi:hypothetical protein
MIDRRAVFFLGAALLSLAIVPLADAGHRWVAVATGATYVVLAACSALDHISRGRERSPEPAPVNDTRPWPGS